MTCETEQTSFDELPTVAVELEFHELACLTRMFDLNLNLEQIHMIVVSSQPCCAAVHSQANTYGRRCRIDTTKTCGLALHLGSLGHRRAVRRPLSQDS